MKEYVHIKEAARNAQYLADAAREVILEVSQQRFYARFAEILKKMVNQNGAHYMGFRFRNEVFRLKEYNLREHGTIHVGLPEEFRPAMVTALEERNHFRSLAERGVVFIATCFTHTKDFSDVLSALPPKLEMLMRQREEFSTLPPASRDLTHLRETYKASYTSLVSVFAVELLY